MGGGNGKRRMLSPGENVQQGQLLGPGQMDVKDRELQSSYGMASNLHQVVAMAGDLVKGLDPEGPFRDSPERERQLKEALEVRKDFVEMELRILRTIRGQTKKCAPFKGMKDLKFIDTDDAKEV